MALRLNDEDLPFDDLWGLVELQAGRYGDKTFLKVADDSVSYAESARRSRQLSAALADLGVDKGDVVGCFAYNQVNAVLVWFACARLGAIYAPFNVSFVRDDLAYVLADTAPSVLFVDIELLEPYAEVRAGLASPPVEVLLNPDPGAAAPAAAQGMHSFNSLLGTEPTAPRSLVGGEDPVAIIYTGGSTGMPKGVLCTHALFIGCGMRYQTCTEATDVDVHLSSHHLFHSGGLQNGVVGPLYCGMTSVMTKWFSASKYWIPVRENGVTVIDPIGTIVAALVRQPASDLDRQHLVRVGVCAATGQIPAADRDEFERRFGVPLLGVYAQTETGGVLIVTETIRDRRYGSCGQTWGWGEMRVIDEQGRTLPPGVVGEILFRPSEPSTFMLEYWNKPEQTVASWRGLWFHSGDLGYLDSDGWLFFVGRQAHWMRRRGENVSAFEVEKVLLAHEAIDECAVVGVPGELGEEDIKAYVVLRPDHAGVEVSVLFPELIEWCQDRMSYFKVPRYVEAVLELPRSAAKAEIERHKLRQLGVGPAWDREAAGMLVGPANRPRS